MSDDVTTGVGDESTSPNQSPSPKMPVLVPQPGGRGAIYHGGVPGNRGGSYPRNRVREIAREQLNAKRLNTLGEILGGTWRDPVDGSPPTPGEMIRAAEVLGRLGGVEREPEVMLPEDMVTALALAVRVLSVTQCLSPDQLARLGEILKMAINGADEAALMARFAQSDDSVPVPGASGCD